MAQRAAARARGGKAASANKPALPASRPRRVTPGLACERMPHWSGSPRRPQAAPSRRMDNRHDASEASA
jgi:hypothetical protein